MKIEETKSVLIGSYIEGRIGDIDRDVGLVRSFWTSSGYHSRLSSGTVIHHVRESARMAGLLLGSGTAEYSELGLTMLKAVLRLQDTDPTRPTFGIWPYTLEEPVAEMSPPDWNWADFIGAELATILSLDPPVLATAERGEVGTALGNAAWCIFRRNIGPDYTNIAVMGAGVTIAAGELLGDRRLTDYGRNRIRNLLDHTLRHGDFNEYNSPTYTFVAIEELERILAIVIDPEVREIAARLHRRAWQGIAEHYHPSTGQIAGPHSRAYSDRLMRSIAEKITACTGIDIPWADPGELDTARIRSERQPSLIPDLPCPADLVGRFTSPPADTFEVKRRFITADRPEDRFEGVTWMENGASLSTVNHESTWVQRHGIIAYWESGGTVPAVFKVRCLKDGREFASVMLYADQTGSAALAGFGLLSNMGDYHLFLDHPADGVFSFEDLRIRFELTGPGSGVSDGPDGGYILSCGGYEAVVSPANGVFAAAPVSWETGRGTDRAWTDAVLYSGPPERFHWPTLHPVRCAAGVALVTAGTGIEFPPVTAHDGPDGCRYPWAAGRTLSVVVPEHPIRYPMDTSIWRQR